MQNDPVNHPAHYTDGKYEVIDVIEGWNLNFHLGNALKYIARAGKKNPDKRIEDLEKAAWYLKRWADKEIPNAFILLNPSPSPYDFAMDKDLDQNLYEAVLAIMTQRPYSALGWLYSELEHLKHSDATEEE